MGKAKHFILPKQQHQTMQQETFCTGSQTWSNRVFRYLESMNCRSLAAEQRDASVADSSTRSPAFNITNNKRAVANWIYVSEISQCQHHQRIQPSTVTVTRLVTPSLTILNLTPTVTSFLFIARHLTILSTSIYCVVCGLPLAMKWSLWPFLITYQLNLL